MLPDRIRMLMWLCAGMVAAGQTGGIPRCCPGLQVESRGEQMILLSDAATWAVDLSRIPVAENECGSSCATVTGPLRERCYGKCVFGGAIVAFDQPAHRVFLQVSTGFSTNRPLVLFEVDLNTGSFQRLLSSFSAGFTHATMSPDRQYLAYAKWTVGGGCLSAASVAVVDLGPAQARDRLQEPVHVAEVPRPGNQAVGAEEFQQVLRIGWQSAYELEIEESRYRIKGLDCEPLDNIRRVMDVRAMRFVKPQPLDLSGK